MMRDFVKLFDLHGREVMFNIDGKRRVKSIFGALIGIITLLLGFTAIWILGEDIYERKKPTLFIQQDTLYSERPEMTLDKNTFPIAVILQKIRSNENFYNPRYFKYVAELNSVDKNGTMNITTYELEKCNRDHFPTIEEETLIKTGVYEFHCIKNQNITISGYWDNAVVKYLMIRIMYCEGEDCVSKEEVQKFLMSEKWTWNIYTIGSLIDITDFRNPIKFYLLNIYRVTQIFSSKLHEIYIKYIEAITDHGLIFEDHRKVITISFDYDIIDTTSEVSGGSIFDFYIFSSAKKTTYYRKYLKFQVLAASLGGMIKFLILCGQLILSIFTENNFNLILIENLFFPEKNNENNHINSFRSELNDLKIDKNKFMTMTRENKGKMCISKAVKILNSNIDNLKIDNKAIKKEKYYFSELDIMKKIFCRSKLKKNLLDNHNYYTKKISENLNIIQIVREIFSLKDLKSKLSIENPEKIYLDKSSTPVLKTPIKRSNAKSRIISLLNNLEEN